RSDCSAVNKVGGGVDLAFGIEKGPDAVAACAHAPTIVRFNEVACDPGTLDRSEVATAGALLVNGVHLAQAKVEEEIVGGSPFENRIVVTGARHVEGH